MTAKKAARGTGKSSKASKPKVTRQKSVAAKKPAAKKPAPKKAGKAPVAHTVAAMKKPVGKKPPVKKTVTAKKSPSKNTGHNDGPPVFQGKVQLRPPQDDRPIPPPTIVPPKPIEKEPPPEYAYDRAAALKALAELVRAFERHDWRLAFKLGGALPRVYPDFIEGVHKAQHIGAICSRMLGRPEQPKTAEDFELLATEHLNRGDGPGALKQTEAGLRKHGKHGGLWYLHACARVQCNQPADAIAALAKAIDFDPHNRIYAVNGKDFAPLRVNPDFLALIRH